MKKTIRKIAISLLLANFAFLGIGLADANISYAAEENLTKDYQTQVNQLSYAIADRATVVSTEVYNSYASAETKAAYEKAIADAQAVLDKGEAATFQELAVATSNINQAKARIWKDAEKIIKIEKLKAAMQKNRAAISSAKFLLENAPNTVSNVKGKLLDQIKKAELILQKSEAYLAKQL